MIRATFAELQNEVLQRLSSPSIDLWYQLEILDGRLRYATLEVINISVRLWIPSRRIVHKDLII